MIPESEYRDDHRQQVSHVVVEGHGLADTADGELSGVMARAELERRECLECEGLGHQPVCRHCEGTGDEPDGH